MTRAIIAIAAGVAGIAFAVLLFQGPDTGADLPEPTTMTSSKAPAAAPTPTPAVVAAATIDAPNAGNKAIELRRAEPDAVNAGTQAATWTAIRREYVNGGGTESVAGEISQLVRDLRDARRNPDMADFSALGNQQADIRTELERTGFDKGNIRTLFDRLDAL
jgi:hypothetical protein